MENIEIIFANHKLCYRCYACVRVCPVHAISFQNGKITIDKQACILCGTCVQVYTLGAIVTYNDIPTVKKWLTTGEQTVAIVDPSFAVAFDHQPGTEHSLITGLRQLGFAVVINTDCSTAIYAGEYQKFLDTAQQQPVISSFCPAIVALVEKYFSSLVNYLAPVKSPIMLTGQWLKKIYPACKTVFIGPCLAKKAVSLANPLDSSIDAVINFKQLKSWFKKNSVVLENLPAGSWDFGKTATTRLLPLAGGLLKILGLSPKVGSLEIIEAHSSVKCISLLHSLSNNLLNPLLVDLLCCDGCLNGPQIATTTSCFEKTRKLIAYADAKNDHPVTPVTSNQSITTLDTKRTFASQQLATKIFSEKQIWEILKQMGKYHARDLTNCGACGYSSCRQHALGVLAGKAEFQMCLPFLLKQFKKSYSNLAMMLMYTNSLEKLASVDSLTGLYNHRSAHQYLEKLIVKFKATGEKFALFLIDIDHFKKINDQYGYQAGDLLLVNLASLLKDFFCKLRRRFCSPLWWRRVYRYRTKSHQRSSC